MSLHGAVQLAGLASTRLICVYRSYSSLQRPRPIVNKIKWYRGGVQYSKVKASGRQGVGVGVMGEVGGRGEGGKGGALGGAS